MSIVDFGTLFCRLLQSANTAVIANFITPEKVGTNPSSILWLLPLVVAIAVAYKATKLPTITAGNFIKEVAVLFGSIVVFMAITAVALYALAWLVTE